MFFGNPLNKNLDGSWTPFALVAQILENRSPGQTAQSAGFLTLKFLNISVAKKNLCTLQIGASMGTRVILHRLGSTVLVSQNSSLKSMLMVLDLLMYTGNPRSKLSCDSVTT